MIRQDPHSKSRFESSTLGFIHKLKKWWIGLFFTALLVISHILIPAINQGNDFLIFTSWHLFSPPQQLQATDIVWGEGQHLFRDHQALIRRAGLNPTVLFNKVESYSQDSRTLSSEDLIKIKNLCRCESVQIVTYDSNRFRFFVLKQNSLVLRSFEL